MVSITLQAMEGEDGLFQQMMYYPKSPPSTSGDSNLDDRDSFDALQQATQSNGPTPANSIPHLNQKASTLPNGHGPTPHQEHRRSPEPKMEHHRPLQTSEPKQEREVNANSVIRRRREDTPAQTPPAEQNHAPVTPAAPKPAPAPAKAPAAKPKRQPKKAEEPVDEAQLAAEAKAKKEEEEWLNAIEKKFRSIAGDDGMISYPEFKKAIDSKQEIFVKSYFRLFDEDGSGEIEMEEFMDSLRKISKQTNLEKLKFLFSVFDTDGDGEVTPEELKVALGACISESSMKFTDDKMDQLVGALMKAADVDGDGVITFEELKVQFEKYPALVENLAVSPSNWLKVHKKPVRPNIFKVIKRSTVNMYQNNKPLLMFLIAHFITFAACFFSAVYRYRKSNGWVMLARGCGMSLNYHSAALAFSMARRSLTFLRNTPIGPYLAVDDHIELHKMLGATTVILGVVHTIAHLANIGIMVSAGHACSFAQILFTHMSGIGFFYGTAYPSGVLLMIALGIIGVCSSPFIRRAGLFEFFYRTHLLYIPYWILTLLHGPIFWMWFLVPGLMIFIEHSYSHIIHQRQKRDKTGFFTTEVNLLPSKVIHLVVTRPKSFKFNAGDYVFIRIPSISEWEWHPFSISSAPEEEGILWIHIRTMGGWTKRLYDLFDKGDYVNSIEEMEEEECWRCGNSHDAPRGGNCKKEKKRGYTIATRQRLPTLAEELPQVTASDFPNKQDYLQYLEAAKEDLEMEAMGEKIKEQILYLAGIKHDQLNDTQSSIAVDSTDSASNVGSIELKKKKRKKRPVKTSVDLFKAIKDRYESKPEPVRNLRNGARSYVDRRKVYIEGPFGSAAVRMGDTNHAILVAAGIGVTPFASVLQSLVTQHRMANEEHGENTPSYKSSNRLKKIDFIWVNRKADDFDWFLTLLTQLEMEEARQGDFDSFLDMHLFMTAAKSSSDLKGVGLQMALELVHQEGDADMITGLKTRTQAGRPNWKKLFQQFKDENKGQVHAYYCGGPAVANVCKAECDNFGFQFSLSL